MSKRQSELPGVERPWHKDIENAADDYVAVRDKRKRLGDDEKAAVEKLIMAMQRAKVTKYRYDGKLIVLRELEQVKVSDEKDGDED